ncbi:zinc finger protein 276 [Aplochiton taeniatus]
MKKRGRRAPHPDVTQKVIAGVKKAPAKRGRPKATPPQTQRTIKALTTADVNSSQKHPEKRSKPPLRRLSTELCRLCHGKFSPRSLRHAFNKWPMLSPQIPEADQRPDGPPAVHSPPVLFHTDFQQLVGVPLDRDPRLSQFVCKTCHTNFYKCHGILLRFLQRVNLLPAGNQSAPDQLNCKSPEPMEKHRSTSLSSITSDPECLLHLVAWAHHHGEACRSCPDLREVLESRCHGSVRAVWRCTDGHSYEMDAQGGRGILSKTHGRANAMRDSASGTLSGGGGVAAQREEGKEEEDGDDAVIPLGGANTAITSLASPVGVHKQTSAHADLTTICTDGFLGSEEIPLSPATLNDRTEDSDLSDRDICIVEDLDKGRKRVSSDDELFEPHPAKSVLVCVSFFCIPRPRKVTATKKRRRAANTPQEPKVRKKPGPKPGWKNKARPKGEELPNIYKCPYQGCTAVYRAPDGMKKHIKEHHEEVRERPCPHPGCNKVFMIDRYLQRHVKLIHTEERNYICDQCGQTFKQRKHLSVHQMRHSGAKPLQCEVCGFQCRQRASLKYHMTKHTAEADLEFACALCGKRFEKAHNLNVHMSMVHPLTQGSQPHQMLYQSNHTFTVTSDSRQCSS